MGQSKEYAESQSMIFGEFFVLAALPLQEASF
jgi:hypothetical protein